MNEDKTLKDLGLLILFIIFFGILCFSGKKIYDSVSQYRESEKLYTEIQEENRVIKEETEEEEITNNKSQSNNKNNNKNNSSSSNNNSKPKKIILNVNFKKLKARNKDCIAWIYIPRTYIDYPVLQSFDDEYYLKHTIDKNWNIAGSIFVDKLNDGFNDQHTIIYGHNMKNKSQFKTVTYYKDQEFYNDHKYIYIGKDDGTTEKYKIFAGYKTTDHVNPYKFNLTMEDFKEMKKKSIIDCGNVKITEDSKIITLSTCTKATGKERFVVHSVLIDVRK